MTQVKEPKKLSQEDIRKKIAFNTKKIEERKKDYLKLKEEYDLVHKAYDHVFGLIMASEKKSESHLLLLVIEDSINTTSKALKSRIETAYNSLTRMTEEVEHLNELRTE